MVNTLFKFHSGLSQWPLKFHPKTNKETAFLIIERLKVSKGSDHFDLSLLGPLASFRKVFRPTRINTNPGPHWISTGSLVTTYMQYYKSLSPHKSHNPVSLTPSPHLTRQKTRIQHIDFPQSLLQESLQITTPILCVIDLVNSMDCCTPSEFPKIKVLTLEK
jgi:hypothetical protein